MLREILATVSIGLGLACCCIAMFGVYRMDYVLSRIHAAAIIDTLGTLLIFIGMILLRGLGWASAKILLILAFQWITSPVSTHRISKAELISNPHYDRHCKVLDGILSPPEAGREYEQNLSKTELMGKPCYDRNCEVKSDGGNN